MAGGTFEHGRLVDNLLMTLRQRLQGRRCQPYSGNFLVRTPSGLGAYPDVMVFCGEIQGDAAEPRRAATNPTVLFEVLSESTEEYDRGEKFENYKSIPSLEAYVLVHQNERRIEVFSRRDGWTRHAADAGQSIELPSSTCASRSTKSTDGTAAERRRGSFAHEGRGRSVSIVGWALGNDFFLRETVTGTGV